MDYNIFTGKCEDNVLKHFHNAGVGGSSPPITTIFYKAFSHMYLLVKNFGTT